GLLFTHAISRELQLLSAAVAFDRTLPDLVGFYRALALRPTSCRSDFVDIEFGVMRLNIRVDSLLTGAERAVGVAVIIDVFRAFTTAAVALANGATKIIMVRDIEEAFGLRAAGVGELCMGEVGGRAPPGFDLGNSPFEASEADLEGRTIIQRPRAGTQAIVPAKRVTRLYAGSLLTARATARAILRQAPADVTLVAMGLDGARRSDEDELCAIHL